MSLTDEQSAALRRQAGAFNRAPAALLRRNVTVGLVGLGAFCVLAFVMFKAWGLALATVSFGLLAGCCLIVVRGVAGDSALYDAARRYVVAGRPVDWFVAAAAATVLVLALAIFHLITFALWMLVGALGLALGIHVALDRTVERQRRGPIREVQELLASLRRGGADEGAARRSVRDHCAEGSQELFDALFGRGEPDAAVVGGAERRTALALRQSAAWRRHMVNWLDRRATARRTRQREPRQTEPAASSTAVADAAAPPRQPTEPATRRGPAPVATVPARPDRPGLDADAALLRSVERGLCEPAGGGGVLFLLGPQFRFLFGALLVAGCLLWMNQNDMVPTDEIGDVSWRLADRHLIERLDEIGSNIADRIDPSDRQVQPLSLPPLPEWLTGWIDDYSAGLAGLMLIFSSLFRGARMSYFAYPAAAVAMFADGWGLPSIWFVTQPWGSALAGLVLLAAGVCFHMVAGAVAVAVPQGKLDERRVSLRNARGETLHEAPGRSGNPQAAALRALRTILVTALRTRASDVHVDPGRTGGWLRMRVDGGMVDLTQVGVDLLPRLINLVKVLCDLDITQHRIVQEGHFSAVITGRSVDYRVSFAPSVHGQNLVIRVLDTACVPQRTADLDLPDWMLRQIQAISRQSSGMLLVCGPTGSGKTTTLYAVMRDIDLKHRNVITIEDPVEYQLDGVMQMPVQESGGSGFSDLLRSALRQDPDVILLGEIRDADTARTAMQAAMTGHLVLSTVHARESVSAVVRLLDLGVEPNLLASSLNLILAQRLVRRLCPHCKSGRKPDPDERALMGAAGETVTRIYQPRGCARCLNAGYLGRRALFELVVVDDAIRRAFLETPTVTGWQAAIHHASFTSLSQLGWQTVAEGVTSVDEVQQI